MALEKIKPVSTESSNLWLAFSFPMHWKIIPMLETTMKLPNLLNYLQFVLLVVQILHNRKQFSYQMAKKKTSQYKWRLSLLKFQRVLNFIGFVNDVCCCLTRLLKLFLFCLKLKEQLNTNKDRAKEKWPHFVFSKDFE